MYMRLSDRLIKRTEDGAFIPADTSNSDYQTYLQWVAAGNQPQQYQPTIEEIASEFEFGIQTFLDKEAQAKGYDDIVSACSYAAAPNPFQTESISFVTWRGDVWAYCYQELAKVKAGTRQLPTLEQIISELPTRM